MLEGLLVWLLCKVRRAEMKGEVGDRVKNAEPKDGDVKQDASGGEGWWVETVPGLTGQGVRTGRARSDPVRATVQTENFLGGYR